MADTQPIMPLILNLLAEEQLAERRNARDPVKMAVAIAIGVVALAVGVGVLFGYQAEGKRTELRELEKQHQKLVGTPVAGDTETLKTDRTFCEEVMAMNHSRALFAPQLALIKEIIPDAIQLTRIGLSLTTEMHEAPMPTPGPVDSGKPRRPPPPIRVDYLTFILEGRATSARPEIDVDDFLKAMRADPRLSDKVKQIQLRSIAPVTVTANPDGSISKAAATAFVIDCQYKELAK